MPRNRTSPKGCGVSSSALWIPQPRGVLVFIRLMGIVLESTRWNLIVSRATHDSLRQFLAGQGRARKGELSRFVEEAVQARIFELTAEEAKWQNAHLSANEIGGIVDEALEWARRA